MSIEFLQAVAELNKANADFAAGVLKPVQHGDAREAALCKAVMAMASALNSTLEPVTHFTSKAELRIVGTFSEHFAGALNLHGNPRTGVLPGAVMSAGQQWCYVNHFDAERLVMEYEKTLSVNCC